MEAFKHLIIFLLNYIFVELTELIKLDLLMFLSIFQMIVRTSNIIGLVLTYFHFFCFVTVKLGNGELRGKVELTKTKQNKFGAEVVFFW